MEVDLRRDDPLGEENTRQYATVISAYCADSATDDKDAWATYMKRIVGLVRPGGTLMIAALRRCSGYVVGGKTFPSPNIDETDLQAVLAPCFGPTGLTIKVCKFGGSDSKGYSSIVLARARVPRCRGTVALRHSATLPPLPAIPWTLATPSRAAERVAQRQ
jgi:hypothetical protein